MSEDIIRAFDVNYSDEWLDIEDFKTIRAEDADEARAIFEDEHMTDDQEVQSVEEAYTLNIGVARRLLGELETFEA